MPQVLLTVSGRMDPARREEIAQGKAPRADYLEMARTFNAELMDYDAARHKCGKLGRVLESFGGMNLVLAWACFKSRNNYRVMITDSEGVGIPLALLCMLFGRAKMRHLMITHVVSTRKKMFFFDWLRVQSCVDTFIVYSRWQKDFIERRWHVPGERVALVPFMVDQHFFAPDRVQSQPQNMICAVGLEGRDYATLLQAVEGVEVEMVIAAASPWSKRRDAIMGADLPKSVTVKEFSQYDLRQLYADSRFVVIPLYEVNFQAGVTAILEAMAMGRAVICSRTPGQSDAIVDGETGMLAEPEDPRALHAAIEYLLQNADVAERMGTAGRRRVEQMYSLDCYVERLNKMVQAALAATE